MIGTTLSNIYISIKNYLITVRNYKYRERIEFNTTTAYNKRTNESVKSNSSKRESSKPFVQLVIKEFRDSYNINSIDEIINDLKRNRKSEIVGMTLFVLLLFIIMLNKTKLMAFLKMNYQ